MLHFFHILLVYFRMVLAVTRSIVVNYCNNKQILNSEVATTDLVDNGQKHRQST